jgi:hypothetical protein
LLAQISVVHAAIGVVRVEVDRGTEAVAEAVDVGRVGVDVLVQAVRVLEEEAESFRVVRRVEGTGGGERGVGLASWAGGLVRKKPTQFARANVGADRERKLP